MDLSHLFLGDFDYRHAIVSRHASGVDAGNAIDFFIHKGSIDAIGAIPSHWAASIDALGLAANGALFVYGNGGLKTTIGSSGSSFNGPIEVSGSPISWNRTKPGTDTGGLHLHGGMSEDCGNAITFGGFGATATAQAGIYVTANSGTGTTMHLGTTDNLSVGSKTAISISPLGDVNVIRGTLAVGTNVVHTVLDSTPVNVENKLVMRDGAGDFSAGVITAELVGNASTATAAVTANTATKLAGFSNSTLADPVDVNALKINGISYANRNVSLYEVTDGALYSQFTSPEWGHQIFGDYRTGQIAVRGRNNRTLTAWRTILDSSNFNLHAPSLTGEGASGTWRINISGNAASVTGFSGVSSGLNTGDQSKESLGLGNVDNTSDEAKPVSAATQVALDAKQPYDPLLASIVSLELSGKAGDVVKINSNEDGFEIGSNIAPVECLIIPVGNQEAIISQGKATATFRIPYAFLLTDIRASLTTAGAGDHLIVDVNQDGSSILSTKLSVPSGKKSSVTSAISVAISDPMLVDDAEITVDVDAVGTGATGLKIYLIGHHTTR